MRVLSWNINGWRAIQRAAFAPFLAEARADLICLQEVRAPAEILPESFGEYHAVWFPAEKAGYAGTGILTRERPLQVIRGMGEAESDAEGRTLAVEFVGCYVVSVYVPNTKRDLSRLPYREKKWDPAFRAWVADLAAKKPVLWAGDMNVAHDERDLTHPDTNRKNHGFTTEERAGFSALLGAGFFDSFRHFEPGGGHYTWWSQMNQARARNVGWRIDYIGVSRSLRDRLRHAWILPHVMGSDHCPVGLEWDAQGLAE